MTVGEGEPRSEPAPGRSRSAVDGLGLAARLRAEVFEAHAEAVRAVAGDPGAPLGRDLVELLALQRRIADLADRLAADEVAGPPRREDDGERIHRSHGEGSSMSVSLAKGGNVSLSKQAPNLTKVAVALGWDVRSTTGADFDLDASAMACGPNQRVVSDKHFVFYNNLRSPEGAIEHTGDNLTGAGEGDDEVINVDLAAMPPTITNIFFPVSIYEAETRRQAFGQVRNAYIRVIDAVTGSELTRFDLSEDASTETAMVFGELYRHGNEWKFRAIGQGYASGLAGIARDYGVNV
ncbi:Tellurium resistance protein TerD [Nocardia seriolae]|uniref:Tellurium resistance protein n=2 Tax=Nocardia seriolae TaxID=37332 RepID=A0ABC9Z1V0_9NOCA|nr:Tellurium resistance protein TerD [Nocardia seriolae]GEM27265.1 hypothetical protein NS2_55040 [Nocardia seriolae NBRC 15557]BEK90646.1 hypothetical protein NSERKGN1266_65970 [Nocardia seriolae]BEK93632.1 hypothetical protein NSER024013_15380 [Nocardia seriolae]GAM49652.1 tellurium resistance protein [Nocardia seriolae]